MTGRCTDVDGFGRLRTYRCAAQRCSGGRVAAKQMLFCDRGRRHAGNQCVTMSVRGRWTAFASCSLLRSGDRAARARLYFAYDGCLPVTVTVKRSASQKPAMASYLPPRRLKAFRAVHEDRAQRLAGRRPSIVEQRRMLSPVMSDDLAASAGESRRHVQRRLFGDERTAEAR